MKIHESALRALCRGSGTVCVTTEDRGNECVEFFQSRRAGFGGVCLAGCFGVTRSVPRFSRRYVPVLSLKAYGHVPADAFFFEAG
jgi:hypothetical protein